MLRGDGLLSHADAGMELQGKKEEPLRYGFPGGGVVRVLYKRNLGAHKETLPQSLQY